MANDDKIFNQKEKDKKKRELLTKVTKSKRLKLK